MALIRTIAGTFQRVAAGLYLAAPPAPVDGEVRPLLIGAGGGLVVEGSAVAVQLVKDAPLTPRGYQQFTVTSAGPAVGFTVPVGAVYAQIQVAAAGAAFARYRDDGVDPTAAVGFPLLVGVLFFYEGTPLSAFKIIGTAAGATTVNVLYYS